MKGLLAVASILIILCASLSARTQEETSGTSEGVVQKDKIALSESAKLKTADNFRDGGTIIAIFTDNFGKELTFLLDSPLYGDPRKVQIVTEYSAGNYADISGKYALKVSGSEENALLKFLRGWVEKNVPVEKRAKLINISKKKADYEAWRKEFSVLSEEEERIYRVLSVISYLEMR